ncbi:MAG: formate dehydrogenase accessory sulfurtransferase FdhD [Anaerolineales bacterium]|nr:formate dehydrogenase accessory sulfurtransferase FdhD [Anaerolineales bacterium]
MPKNGIEPISYQKVSAGRWEPVETHTIVEAPVNLTVNGQVWLSFMCTPVDLEALAIGFLFNEGVIQSMDEVALVQPCDAGDNVDVWLTHAVEKPEHWRHTSGCTGGITSVEMKAPPVNQLNNGFSLSHTTIGVLITSLFEAQQLYRMAGGVHTSALSDGKEIIVSSEDIGRHNSLDKIAGHLLIEKLNPRRRILLTTGRISSEMLQKSARMGASIVISRTSPSSLSIQMAEEWGITLIGYAHRASFNIYTHPERIWLVSEDLTTPVTSQPG